MRARVQASHPLSPSRVRKIQSIALHWPAYGYRRVHRELIRGGWRINHKRVLRLMRADNLLCLRRRKFILTTDSKHGLPIYPNLAKDLVLTGINQLEQHGIRISMSRRGNVYDNATAESFIKTLKYEEVYRTEYRNLEEAKASIKEFLEKIYNQKRLHSALGYRPPREFEQSLSLSSRRAKGAAA
jgi:transposase InsO family protein